MHHEGQSSDSLSSRGVLGDSSPAWPLQVEGEARSETQPDRGGEHHRADLRSWTQWMQKRPLRQQCRCQQVPPPCVRTFSECLLVAPPGPCGYRSRAIFDRRYKPTNRKFRWRPEAPPVQQIRPPDRQKNGVKLLIDQERRS